MWGAFRGIKRLFTGEMIKKIDVPIWSAGSGLRVSVMLKADKGGPYFILALKMPGKYTYWPMDIDEFHALFNALEEIRTAESGLQKRGNSTVQRS